MWCNGLGSASRRDISQARHHVESTASCPGGLTLDQWSGVRHRGNAVVPCLGEGCEGAPRKPSVSPPSPLIRPSGSSCSLSQLRVPGSNPLFLASPAPHGSPSKMDGMHRSLLQTNAQWNGDQVSELAGQGVEQCGDAAGSACSSLRYSTPVRPCSSQVAPLFGYLGAASALVFACMVWE